MTYKQEMLDLVLELRNQANKIDFANDPDAFTKSEKLQRQAEVLEFLVTHPEQIVDIFKEQEANE